MTMETLRKESLYLRLAYSFKGLAHYPHDEEHGGTQADMVAESCSSRSKGSKKREALGLELAFLNLKAHPQ